MIPDRVLDRLLRDAKTVARVVITPTGAERVPIPSDDLNDILKNTIQAVVYFKREVDMVTAAMSKVQGENEAVRLAFHIEKNTTKFLVRLLSFVIISQVVFLVGIIAILSAAIYLERVRGAL